ncbi:hypothetical protein [Treponema sp. R80B11-R83G3]
MKKICFTVIITFLVSVLAFADDAVMTFSGEVKTGLLWDLIEEPGQTTIDRARIGNNDDAGIPGRIRLDGELKKDNIGFKMRWETQNFKGVAPMWAYAMAYGDFIDNQLRLSGGRLGQSPWSSDGPEIWDELDNLAGLRVEIKPNFLPGLNVGFVLNENNTDTTNTDFSILPLLQETIVGFSYTNDYFMIRAEYRFDSDKDSNLTASGMSEGTDLIYRVEERALRKVAPVSIWANGRLLGIGAEEESRTNYINWLYIQINPGALDLQIRTGLDYGLKKYMFKLKPVISYGLTDFFRIGFTLIYNKDFGEAATAPDAPYTVLAFEPMVRVDFTNMYVALAYQFNREYKAADRIKQTNWVNLRFVYTF